MCFQVEILLCTGKCAVQENFHAREVVFQFVIWHPLDIGHM
jgi:hypothetical protein